MNPEDLSYVGTGDNAQAFAGISAGNTALARAIVANPGNYSPGQVAAAQKYLADPNTGGTLDSSNFLTGGLGGAVQSTEDFGSAVVDNVVAAGQDVAQIGKGVLNTAALAGWLIPLAALLVVGILLYGFFKKQTA